MKARFLRKALFVAIVSGLPLIIPAGTQFVQGGAAMAQASPLQPKEGWYKQLVDTEFVRGYVETPPRKDVMIIDARPAARQYDPGHIPGAVNIPDSKFEQMTGLLPADKAKLIVVYCGGLECMLSHNVAHKLEKLGYTNVKVYPEGNPEWAKRGLPLAVSTAYVKKLMDDKEKFMLIDARPKRVFDKGYIPGAINISDTDFDKNVDKLPADKASFLVYYCGGIECVLSDKSAEKARKLGYTNVKTYPEGYPGWIAAYPNLSAGGDAAGTAAPPPKAVDIAQGKDKGSIAVASFDKIMKESPGSVMLVDTRDAKEFANGSIKGAVNIPINQLEKVIGTLPSDKPVIFFCGTGARAGEAYDTVKLIRAEVQAWFVDAEMKFNVDGTYVVTKGR